jgi:hypothetical protein
MKEAYLILSFLVILHGGSDTPGRHASQIGLLVLEQLHQRGPETHWLEVVRVINSLNQLLEVVHGDQLVLHIGFIGVHNFHGGAHEIGLGWSAEKCPDHIWGKALSGFGGIGSTALRSLRNLRVGDTPFEELVHLGIHGNSVGGVEGLMEGW